jgi:histidinol-phosphatase (PHP family)
MIDCHVHSHFSGDSKININDALIKAKEIGLKGISFTDHIDYDYPQNDNILYELDMEKYNSEMEKQKENNNEYFKVFKGVEVGVQSHVIEKIIKTVKENQFDIVIASIHVIEKKELHNGDFCKNKSKNEAYRQFFEKTNEILAKFNEFDILGHIDFIRRYGNYAETSLDYMQFFDVVDPILKLLIRNQKGLEINTSGFRYGLKDTLPSISVIKRFRELGGEILTVGSDAHNTKDIGFMLDYAKEMAVNAGFRYLAHFENRKVFFDKIVTK